MSGAPPDYAERNTRSGYWGKNLSRRETGCADPASEQGQPMGEAPLDIRKSIHAAALAMIDNKLQLLIAAGGNSSL